MHVCQIIDAFTSDGAQRLIVNFARLARARGIKVSAVGVEESTSDIVWKELEALGVDIWLSQAGKLYDPGRILRLSRELRARRVDVIQSHLAYANILSAVVGRTAGIPVVSTLHTSNYRNQYYRAVIFRAEMAMLRYASNGVVAVAEAVKQAYSDFIPPGRITVIPNPVFPIPDLPVEEKNAIRAQFLANLDDPLLLATGRLTEPKGYRDLIAAFASIHQSRPDARLIIAGRGELREEMERQIGGLGLTGKIFLLGERSDVPALLAASDLFVSASHWEGMPLSILEAMSAGKAVIATAVGGVPEILSGNGILVAPREPEELARAAVNLLTRPDEIKRWGEKARAYAAERHDPEKWFEEMLATYRRFL